MLKENQTIGSSFKEICNGLDIQHKKYTEGKTKTYTSDQLWSEIKNRKSTFLTSK